MPSIFKKIAIASLLVSCITNAKVNPPNLKYCKPNVSGVITGLYSDNWSQKVAVEIGGNFYYLSYRTIDANIVTTFNLLSAARVLGSTVTILECHGSDISSVLAR